MKTKLKKGKNEGKMTVKEKEGKRKWVMEGWNRDVNKKSVSEASS